MGLVGALHEIALRCYMLCERLGRVGRRRFALCCASLNSGESWSVRVPPPPLSSVLGEKSFSEGLSAPSCVLEGGLPMGEGLGVFYVKGRICCAVKGRRKLFWGGSALPHSDCIMEKELIIIIIII